MPDDLEVPSANEWGRKRTEFYVTPKSRIREDGNLNEEEQELLELEENDAVERQRKMDSINSLMDPKKLASFADVSDDESDDDAWAEKETQKLSKFSAPQSSGPLKRITLSKKKPTTMGQLRLEANKKESTKPKKSVHFDLPTTSKQKGSGQKKRKADFVDGWDEEVPAKKRADDNEHREIGYDIQKNKGMLQKRKKEARHSRIKRRAQYKKALIKRRSQVPDVKRETSKYSGESRGIRMSTVRSVPLKA